MVEKGLGRESDDVIVGVTAEGLKRFIVQKFKYADRKQAQGIKKKHEYYIANSSKEQRDQFFERVLAYVVRLIKK